MTTAEQIRADPDARKYKEQWLSQLGPVAQTLEMLLPPDIRWQISRAVDELLKQIEHKEAEHYHALLSELRGRPEFVHIKDNKYPFMDIAMQLKYPPLRAALEKRCMYEALYQIFEGIGKRAYEC